MTKQELKKLIDNGKPIFLDGATGSNLQKRGMPTGVCPELWILENKDVLINLQREYVKAGTNILLAPTFTGNRIKLAEYGLEDRIEEINRGLVKLSREAGGENILIAGDLTMTGEQLEPMGTLKFEELVDIYKEQVSYLLKENVDLFIIETMMSLGEARACVIAIKETCDLPIMVSMTYNEDGRTLFGTDPITATVVLQSLGVDVIGINCSTAPKEMIPLIKQIREYANIPIMAKPNAGLPKLVDNETVYIMTPEEFAEYGKELIKIGVSVIGGCCGTTPNHIEKLVETVKDIDTLPVNSKYRSAIASERKTVDIKLNGNFMVVGERINPTGKKKLQAELKEGNFELVINMAEEQEKAGASILDINMGMNGIDEKEMMLKAINEVSMATNLPLCIDSSHIDIIESALRVYNGRALINSISLEKEKFEKLLPIAKKYGAMFVLLPLSDEGLPKDLEDKKRIINIILDEAIRIGFRKEDIIVDGLVTTIGANKFAGIETLETISYCKNELGLRTICGLSNISFGLPERAYINSAFLTMAIKEGLTMAIANPSQDLLMNIAFASDLLLNKEESDLRYINRINENKIDNIIALKEKSKEEKPKVYELVLKGNKDNILKEVEICLNNGLKPDNIINEFLIPAINEVGELFNKKIYFLPQLIASAEAMKKAIEYLEPLLENKNNGKDMPTIVIATVEGDIHDIGKNLVALMLKNYGYKVIDLGKDVKKEIIVETAIRENAKIIGLSALMTTTMIRMKEVVEYAKEKNCTAKIIIGGAVITESFAEEINADGYSKDAADSVKLVQRLLG